MAEQTDLLVIGGGPGGYPAAFKAAELGLKVTIVEERDVLGGVCLNCGCIPSKALLHAAGVLESAEAAGEMGISFGEPKVEVTKLRDWKQSVIDKLTGGLKFLAGKHKVTVVQGRASFVDAGTVSVKAADGGESQISFRNAIIATGSEPVKLPFAPESDRIMDSTGALELADIPETLLVVGGGYIGLELGQAYAALGSKVSVVEMLPGLLTGVDADLAKLLVKRLEEQFEEIRLSTKVSSMEETAEGIEVIFDGGESVTYDKVLMAVGRRTNFEGLGLENTAVKVGADGFIEVDGQRRTAEPGIFAVGDAVGQPMLAHKATHEGYVAAEAAAGKKTVFEPMAIPAVVFTDPEIAWCGLTEGEAKEKGVSVRVAKFPWSACGRAATLGRTDGVTKILFEPDTQRVLGVGIAGHGAGELIAEGVLAIEMGAVVEDLALTIHPHPTLSETIMEAAEGKE